MPWRETNHVKERMKFIAELDSEEKTNFSELCEKFGISRQTGYEWKRRFEKDGVRGLEDRPPLAHRHPNATAAEMEDRVVELRKRYARWGPKKLRAILEKETPDAVLPAASTIGEILTRRGLTAPRKRRLRVPPNPANLVAATCPNAVWTTDHKGHFRLQSGRCYPLTICDAYSRYFLRCEALTSTSEAAAWPHYEAAFREYGLPAAIVSDNGVPFATANTPGRLSRLSVWWVKLGIELRRIEPGHPEQNGAHERLHLTLEEAIDEGQHDLVEQQRRFDAFRREYNHERPHESLGMRTPARVYETSWRPYPAVVQSPQYDPDDAVRRVTPNGRLTWRGHDFFLTKVLCGEWVAFREFDDDRFSVHFGPVFLCVVDLRHGELKLSYRPPVRGVPPTEPDDDIRCSD